MNVSCAEVVLRYDSIQLAYGFDIEADGSIGALSIDGVIETKANGLKCDVEVKVTSFSKMYDITCYTVTIFTVYDKQQVHWQ